MNLKSEKLLMIVPSIFFIWILFFDQESLYSLYKIKSKILEKKKEISEMKRQIEQIELQKKNMENPLFLEKFAREKYLMKKEHETLYIIQE